MVMNTKSDEIYLYDLKTQKVKKTSTIPTDKLIRKFLKIGPYSNRLYIGYSEGFIEIRDKENLSVISKI